MTQPTDNIIARRQYIEIVLVDDSPDFLESASDYLARLPGLKVVGRFAECAAGLAAVKSLQPDLVLLDFVFPAGNALEVTRSIKAQADAPKVILVSLMEGTAYRAAAREAGADGYINKAEFAVTLPELIDMLFPSKLKCVDGVA